MEARFSWVDNGDGKALFIKLRYREFLTLEILSAFNQFFNFVVPLKKSFRAPSLLLNHVTPRRVLTSENFISNEWNKFSRDCLLSDFNPFRKVTSCQ